MLFAFSVAPSTTDDPNGSVSKSVAAALKVVQDSGLPYELGSMFTTIEGDWDEAMAVIKRATEVVGEHSPRVSLVVKADIRPGYDGQITAKVARVNEHLGNSSMSLADYEIRPPRPEDAPSLGRAHVRIWQEAYAGLMDPDYLANLDPKKREERWEKIIASIPAGRRSLVAIERSSGEAVGFITVDKARDRNPATPIELWAINLLAAHHGTGVAQELLDRALGDEDAYLWVVEGNERAQAFYRRNGFAVDGGIKRDDDLGVDELRMTRRR